MFCGRLRHEMWIVTERMYPVFTAPALASENIVVATAQNTLVSLVKKCMFRNRSKDTLRAAPQAQSAVYPHLSFSSVCLVSIKNLRIRHYIRREYCS